MRFLRRSLVGLFLLATTLGLLAFGVGQVREAVQAQAAEEPRQRPARERVFAVNVVLIEPQQISPMLSVFGQVQSRRSLDVRASVSGTVTELSEAFVDGGRVEAGDVLLQVDTADAETALSLAHAELAEAEAEVIEASRALVLSRDELTAAQETAALQDRAFERQRDLVERGVGTAAAVESAELTANSSRQSVLSRRQSVQSAEQRVNSANSLVARARISLEEAERDLKNTTVFAAFSGTLSDVAIVEGGIVNQNERLATLIDPDRLEVEVRVSTSQYARLLDENGALRQADVTVSLDAFGEDIESSGALSRVSAAVGEGQTGRLLFVSLETAPGFRPGDFVSVGISEPAIRGVARLPATALSAASQVLVVGEEDRLREAEVELLRRQGDDVLVRARGLAGETIVSERSPLLGAGIKVRVLEPEGQIEEPQAPEMIALDATKRAELIAMIESNNRMPAAAKERVIAQLEKPEVPVELIARLERRSGG